MGKCYSGRCEQPLHADVDGGHLPCLPQYSLADRKHNPVLIILIYMSLYIKWAFLTSSLPFCTRLPPLYSAKVFSGKTVRKQKAQHVTWVWSLPGRMHFISGLKFTMKDSVALLCCVTTIPWEKLVISVTQNFIKNEVRSQRIQSPPQMSCALHKMYGILCIVLIYKWIFLKNTLG